MGCLLSFEIKPTIDSTLADILAQCRIPRATCRFQFRLDFTLRQVEVLLPYLDSLGISDCYTPL